VNNRTQEYILYLFSKFNFNFALNKLVQSKILHMLTLPGKEMQVFFKPKCQ